MVGVHRLVNEGDFAYEADAGRIADLMNAVTPTNVGFYAATSGDWCTQAMQVATKGAAHRTPRPR